MTRRFRRRLLHIVSFVLAAGLLYLAFRSVDMQEVVAAFRAADYRWVLPLVALLIGANVLRAWRWQVMVDALPDRALSDESPVAHTTKETKETSRAPLDETFGALMVGYMVNYIAPRVGEVARTVNLSARTNVRFSSLFGTVVSERILDTAVLAGAVGSAFLLLLDRLPVLHEAILAPFWDRVAALPTVTIAWSVGGSGVVLLLLGYGLWRGLRNSRSFLRALWNDTVQPALVSFRDGMMTLITSPRRAVIFGSTVGMWGGYLLLAYLPFVMLNLAGPYDISLLDAWILMAIGALGLLVPAPGGLGSYHYITILALGLFYDMPEAEAATYAVLTHAAQMVFYTLAGLLTLAIQGATGERALQTTTPVPDDGGASVPS